MSQKVSPILFNNVVYNNSKWFNKNSNKNKYLLNEDLQIREIINIVFKHNVNFQFLFVDKIIIYKYFSKFKIFVYFFCNFKYLKKNIIESNNFNNKQYINIIYIYYKYNEILQQKKIDIIKLLYSLKHKDYNVYVYFKNINTIYNSKKKFLTNRYFLKRNKSLSNKLQKFGKKRNLHLFKVKNYNKNVVMTLNKYTEVKTEKKLKKNKHKNYNKFRRNKKRYKLQHYFYKLKYYKTIHFLLYNLCFNDKFLNKITVSSLLNVLYFELNYVNNATKNYNFLFYNNFNLMREYLTRYLKNDNCKLKGIRIKVKGRFFLTKRKRVFLFNLGELNLNRIDHNKDYQCLHLIKSTGSSSIKIWVNYK